MPASRAKRYIALTLVNISDRWGEWWTPRPGRFNPPPPRKDLVPTEQEAEWGPGSVWTSDTATSYAYLVFSGIFLTMFSKLPVVNPFQWPLGLRFGSAVSRLLGLWVRIPPGLGCLFLVNVVCFQLEVSASG